MGGRSAGSCESVASLAGKLGAVWELYCAGLAGGRNFFSFISLQAIQDYVLGSRRLWHLPLHSLRGLLNPSIRLARLALFQGLAAV